MNNVWNSNNMTKNKVLVICPHTDDEFGCAGTIYRMVQEGAEIKYIALSRCEASVPPSFPKDILEIECKKCTSVLGIKQELVTILNYPVRHFPQYRQDILELFVKINNEYQPDLVLLPSSYDTHQDHSTVYNEGFRAFKHSSLLGYELPQNLVFFSNSAFIKLSEECILKKLDAMSQYKSQDFRKYATADFIKGLAHVRGAQCNHTYAEAYEVIRIIV